MDWLQAFAIVGSTIGACWYFTKDNEKKIDSIHETLKEIQKESKDFHGRLCALEERYFQMMQRFLEEKTK